MWGEGDTIQFSTGTSLNWKIPQGKSHILSNFHRESNTEYDASPKQIVNG